MSDVNYAEKGHEFGTLAEQYGEDGKISEAVQAHLSAAGKNCTAIERFNN
jgi:hypothetical protein